MSQEFNSLPPSQPRTSRIISVSMFVFGIVLPIIAITVELFFHLCTEVFFNPIPSIWHGLLIISVPILNFFIWLQWKKPKTKKRLNMLLLANTVTIGISAYYTILFLPTMFISLLLIVFMGLGLLPLTPLFSLIVGLYIMRKMRSSQSIEQQGPIMKPCWGIMVAFFILLLLDAPITITRIGLSLADSKPIATHRQGLSLLRVLGNRDQMLRACYERPGFTTDIIGALCNIINPINPSDARKIYYQVTGTNFNSVPPPRLTGRGAWDYSDEWFFDEDQGGQTVAAVIKGLFLSGSRIDTSIDPDAALSYSEWTLTFSNRSKPQHEARAQILLPPGGVVSRLTLWVNGEEREAAFAKRSFVRAAYQQVVRSQRDPVLVTTTGPDRILLQCFPVPPEGGTMKVRIGITAPLSLESPYSHGYLYMPTFIERNFLIPNEMKHSVWVESRAKLTSNSGNLKPSANRDHTFALRGSIDDGSLPERTQIIAQRNPLIYLAYTPDPLRKGFIQQRMNPISKPVIKNFIVVIDGSASLREFKTQFKAILPSIPPETGLRFIIAGDRLWDKVFPPGIHRVEAISSWLKKIRFQGGQDNLPALLKAYDTALDNNVDTVVFWIHGPQPLLLSSADPLEQRFDRKPGMVHIDEYQIVSGPHLILENLGRHFNSITYSGNPDADLTRYFETLTEKRTEIKLLREKVPNPQTGISSGIRTSSHLARLWAYEQVMKLIDSGRPKDMERAVTIAANYQIVTPISGAVVLESQAQYKEAGLKPVDPDTVPTVPEPEQWILLILVSSLLLGCYWLKAWRWRFQ